MIETDVRYCEGCTVGACSSCVVAQKKRKETEHEIAPRRSTQSGKPNARWTDQRRLDRLTSPTQQIVGPLRVHFECVVASLRVVVVKATEAVLLLEKKTIP